MSSTSAHVDRAKEVFRKLKAFRSACFNNLSVDGCPLEHSAYYQRCLQMFEGVPDVYPHAWALLSELGPGHGRSVDWLPDACEPALRSILGDVAFLARGIIIGTWEWPEGLSRSILDALVSERKATGCPTMRARNAEYMAKTEENLALCTPEQAAEMHTPEPEFDVEIPSDKREQFDRIVAMRVDCFKNLPRAMAAASGDYFRSPDYINWVKWNTYDHIDDLDGEEERWSDPKPSDPARAAREWKEYELYQYTPLIGAKPATLNMRTLLQMDLYRAELREAIRDEARRVASSEARRFKIPLRLRTEAMSKKDAAKRLGITGPKAVQTLTNLIKSGVYDCDMITDQRFYFNRDQFPSLPN